MNAPTETTEPTSAHIQERIDSERNRLAIEAHLKDELDRHRLEALEGGNDEALVQIEASMTQCLERQRRIEERIALLQKRQQTAIESEAATELDAVASEADRARILGESLFAEYGKHANAMRKVFERMQAIDSLIETNNARLVAAGRDTIESPNNIRNRCESAIKPLWASVDLPRATNEASPIWDTFQQTDVRYYTPGYVISDHDLQLQAVRDAEIAKLKAELCEPTRTTVKAPRHKAE